MTICEKKKIQKAKLLGFLTRKFIRRSIFHNKIMISRLKYIRNPKSQRSCNLEIETFVVISTRVIRKIAKIQTQTICPTVRQKMKKRVQNHVSEFVEMMRAGGFILQQKVFNFPLPCTSIGNTNPQICKKGPSQTHFSLNQQISTRAES